MNKIMKIQENKIKLSTQTVNKHNIYIKSLMTSNLDLSTLYLQVRRMIVNVKYIKIRISEEITTSIN